MRRRPEHLPEELRTLVRETVAVLGEVIRRELGPKGYAQIESIRRRMTGLRGQDPRRTVPVLRRTLAELERLDAPARHRFALAYALMLEVMNACENAYRTLRLRTERAELPARPPEAIIYVLTAHPTEARSPENIAAFHDLQRLLVEALERGFGRRREAIRHAVELAWRTPVFRTRKPTVLDEAEHVHTTLFRESSFRALLQFSREVTPVYARSWVGGDKDGHPGVDARATAGSLHSSRVRLLAHAESRLADVESDLRLLMDLGQARRLRAGVNRVRRTLRPLRTLRIGDARRVRALRAVVRALAQDYERDIGSLHPALIELRGLLATFPGLVLPLELRESSDVLMAGVARGGPGRPRQGELAIEGMMRWLARVSEGGDVRWYARALIISMTSEAAHIRAGVELAQRCLGARALPVVPLFEEEASLLKARGVMSELFAEPAFRRRVRTHWDGRFEVMVGYSDSAKEAGVLASRLGVAIALGELEALCLRHGITPVFFHGSGGSVDRGGGSIRDQVAWWPKSALELYKATVQGEMVERSFASAEITRGQLTRIAQSAGRLLERPRSRYRPAPGVREFADRVSAAYRRAIHDDRFLEIVERGTPYPYLSALRIGSRPTKRKAAKLAVTALRAIPWVLCWTQTRVLFPTWWGVGSAWRDSPPAARARLRRAFRTDPLFATYVRALGFTLAKVELPVWSMYLERSGLDPAFAARALDRFVAECRAAHEFFHGVTGERDLIWFRPWLGESIVLRAPMIHPLNLMQVLALQDSDLTLLRLTVTGISSGMMTTG
jgi:phosphoenolpyruvate carboxylase